MSDPYENLAAYIILDAVMDIRMAARNNWDERSTINAINFFIDPQFSFWFELVGINPDYLLKVLDEPMQKLLESLDPILIEINPCLKKLKKERSVGDDVHGEGEDDDGMGEPGGEDGGPGGDRGVDQEGGPGGGDVPGAVRGEDVL